MYYMGLHKSFGVLMLLAIVPRIIFRNKAKSLGKIPSKLPGNSIEHVLSDASHNLFYFMMIFMPGIMIFMI